MRWFVGLVILVVQLAQPLLAQPRFVIEPRVVLGSGQPTGAVAVADFDEDGRLDVAFCQAENGRIAVLLRAQEGLAAASFLEIGAACGGVVTGDIDGDGWVDLVVIESEAAALRYLRGRGDGSFAAGESVAIGSAARAVATGDFNHDGRDDLAVAVRFGAVGAVEVQIADDSGGFGPAILFPAPDIVAALTVADIDADGHLDIVASRTTTDITVLFGRGNGSFAVQVETVPAYADVLATADLDGDHRPEILIAHTATDRITVLSPDPERRFAAPQLLNVAGGPTQMVSGDFTGDGSTDVVVLLSRTRVVALLHGDGTGGLERGRSFIAAADPRVVAALPLNEDSLMDLVVAGQELPQAKLALLLATGNGFVAVEGVSHSAVAAAAVVADFDDDATPDFAVALAGLARVQVLLSNPLGGSLPPVAGGEVTFAVSRLRVGDFNGDRLPDIVATRSNGRNYAILRNLGGGRLAGNTQTLPGDRLITGVATGDFNNDGHDDLLFTRQGGFLTWLNGRGDGTFFNPVNIGLTRAVEEPQLADLNGDGRTDLVMVGAAPTLVLALRSADTFLEAAPLTVGPRTVGIAVADFDADGFDDLAVRDGADGQLRIYVGRGNGSFSAPQTLFAGTVAQGVVARDLDSDGDVDLVASNLNGNELIVFDNDGQGRFTILDRLPAGFRPNLVLSGDFDRDGAYDLLTLQSSTGAASLVTNVSPVRRRRGDANGDQRLSAADLVATVAELSDSDGIRVDDASRRRRSFAGVDANGDGMVTRQDLWHLPGLVFTR